MTVYFATGYVNQATTAYTFASSDRFYQSSSSQILVSGSVPAIEALGSGVEMVLAGQVAAYYEAVVVGDMAAASGTSTHNRLTIESTGSVVSLAAAAVVLCDQHSALANFGSLTGYQGIQSGFFIANDATDAQINNFGQISAEQCGMLLSQFSGTILNAGTITATGYVTGSSSGMIGDLMGGILVVGESVHIGNSGSISATSARGFGIAVDGNGTVVQNSGLVDAMSTDAARGTIYLATVLGETARLINQDLGVIRAMTTAVTGLAGAETVINRGEIVGDVRLGDGDDVFRGGLGVLDGQLLGEAGNDRLISGGEDDYADGGAGRDTVRGGAGADMLLGGLQNDSLFGETGDDTLQGGAGQDLLTGAAGNDVFMFLTAGEAGNGSLGDQVADFQTGLDDIDISHIKAGQVFIGAAAFSSVAGQVRYATGVLSGDVNGDGVADYAIKLLSGSLVAADLIL